MNKGVKSVQVRTGTAKRVRGNPLENEATARLPHERDESGDSQASAPREDMVQAAADLERGLVDTDCHGVRGIEK
jgi:hypothetical protein